MKRIGIFLVFSALMFSSYKDSLAESFLPDECKPQVINNLKQIICPEGTELTLQQQKRLRDFNVLVEKKQKEIRNELNVENKVKLRKNLISPTISITPIKERLRERQREQARKFFGQMYKRISATIERVNILANRLENRLNDLKNDDGVNVNSYLSDINKARTLLDKAESDLEALQATIKDLLESDNPIQIYKTIHDNISSIKDNIKDARGILVKIIGDLKGLHVGWYKSIVTTTISPTPVNTSTPTPTLTETPTPVVTIVEPL